MSRCMAASTVAIETQVVVRVTGEALEAISSDRLHQAFEASDVLMLVRFQGEAALHLLDGL